MKNVLTFKFSKPINLYCFTDVHIGSKYHDVITFKKAIDALKKDKDGYCFFNGDTIDFNPGGYHGATNEQSIGNDEQIEELTKLIKSLGNKVLFIRPGNHELRAAHLSDVNIIKHLSRETNCPILHVGTAQTNIYIGKKLLRLITSHGIGGKSKSVLTRMKDNYEGRDLYFAGHTHEFTNHSEGFMTTNLDLGYEVDIPSAPMLAGGSFQLYSDYARTANMRKTQTGCYILTLDQSGIKIKEKLVA